MPDYPVIVDRKIRVALVGCGRISSNPFDAIEKHSERVELVSVCDNNAAALEKAVARTGAQGFRNLSALLENTMAALVVLATLSGGIQSKPTGCPIWAPCYD